MCVECAFGWLKERWRVLTGVMAESSMERTLHLLTSCFVLHNIFVNLNDTLFVDDDPLRDSNLYTQPIRPIRSTPAESDQILRQMAKNRRDAMSDMVSNP